MSRRRFGSALAAARGALGLTAAELAANAPRTAALGSHTTGKRTAPSATPGGLALTADVLTRYELGHAHLTGPDITQLVALYRIGTRRFSQELWIPVLDTSSAVPDDPYARLAAAVVADEPTLSPIDLGVRYLAVRSLLRGSVDTSVGNQEQAVISQCLRRAPASLNRGLRDLADPVDAVRRMGEELAERTVVPHTGVLIGSGPGGMLLMRQRHRDNVGGPGRGRRQPAAGPLSNYSVA